MKTVNHIAALCIVCVACGIGAASPPINDEPPALIAILKQILDEALRLEEAPDTRLQMLAPPILLPDYVEGPSEVPAGLDVFESVPEQGNVVFRSGDKRISNQLSTIIPTIELGSRLLTSDQKTQLSDAKKLLVDADNPERPSSALEKYRQFEAKYNETAERLRTSQNDAEKVNLRNTLKTVEQDWLIFGRRQDISQAMNVVAALDAKRDLEDLESWSTTAAKASANYGNFWKSFVHDSDWLAITQSITTPIHDGKLVFTDEQGVSTSVKMPTVQSISMRVQRVRIVRPWVSHPFLRSRNWRSSKSLLLSDGNPKSTDASELIPRYVAEVIVAKGVEIRFSSSDEWLAVSKQLRNANEISLGGLPLKAGPDGAVYLGPQYLAVANPYVLAVLVRELPKVPDPDASLEWKKEESR